MDFKKLQKAFFEGRIEKKLYWRLVRENYTSPLAQLPAVIKEGRDIRKITIDQDGCYLEDNEGMKIPFFFDETFCRAESELAFGIDYEKADMEVVVRYLNAVSAKCVLDIGANAGLYSLSLERMSGGTAREYFLFEPLAPTYEKLKKTLMINEADMTRFHPINCGMSDKKESTYFYLPGASEAASLMPVEDEFYLKKSRADGSYTGGNVMTRELCQVTTVDSFIDENHIEGVDFIKIDVEGNEKFVLHGARDTLERFHPFCYCELLRKHSRRFGYHPNEVISYMKELGYNTFTLHESRLTEVEEITEETEETNFFFATREQETIILR